MEREAIRALRAIGISAGIILLILIITLSYFIYAKTLETKLRRLQIIQAERDLGMESESLAERLHLRNSQKQTNTTNIN